MFFAFGAHARAHQGRVLPSFLRFLRRSGTRHNHADTVFTDIHFDKRKHHRNRFAHLAEHRFEHPERLGLVFVQRVALAECAQINALSQMVEIEQMLFPVLVENLEHDSFFNAAPVVRTCIGDLSREFRVSRLGDALLYFLVGDAFFPGPVCNRQIEPQKAHAFRMQRVDIPLFGVCAVRNRRADRILDCLVAHIAHQIFN